MNKWESSLSATLGKLDGDSSNIIDLIQESYDVSKDVLIESILLNFYIYRMIFGYNPFYIKPKN